METSRRHCKEMKDADGDGESTIGRDEARERGNNMRLVATPQMCQYI